MAIVQTEVESIHGDASGMRVIYYRCQDDAGEWHSFGPLMSFDPTFVPEDHFAAIADKVAQSLAASEFEGAIE